MAAMCGIGGILDLMERAVPCEALSQMATTLRHRGPDDWAIWAEGNVGFAHTRLAIIDTAASRQPMTSADGNHVLTFNGEIYNYREVRSKLDYPFTTSGDTEVLLAAFQQQGVDCLQPMHGQFAFAVWNSQRRELTLCRDRFGILPLYYSCDDSVFAFASEPKALLPLVAGGAAVDETSLADYLALRYVPAPDTLYRHVKKVLPGHYLIVSADRPPRQVPYWQVADSPSAAADPAAAADAVDERLRDSVRLGLVADVPVGAYLSGGVDSSLIVAVTRALRPEQELNTFTAGFPGETAIDERPVARRVSELLGTKHHEVEASPRDFEELWPRLTWYRDAPLSEPAEIAIFLLSQLASEHVKVVLSGEGSDELFAGYSKYAVVRPFSMAANVPVALRRPLARLGARLAPTSSRQLQNAMRLLTAPSPAAVAEGWFSSFLPDERTALYPGHPGRGTYREVWSKATGSPIRRLMQADLRTWLPDNLLERGDRMSMANSVESRPVFLDDSLATLALSLPDRVRVNGRETKSVVKAVALRYLPRDIVYRQKVGFRAPLGEWFRYGLRDVTNDLLRSPDSLARSMFTTRVLDELIDRHQRGDANEEQRLWALLSLEIWHRTCVHNAGTPEPARP
jgi:asparagine synthase (glutamine-hydrolysing)